MSILDQSLLRLDHGWRRVLGHLPDEKVPRPHVLAPMVVDVLWRPTKIRTQREKDSLIAAVQEAIEIREAEPSTTRDDIEAWLLTGLACADVAKRTGTIERVVRAYRDLYFDVGPWLAGDIHQLNQLASQVVPVEVKTVGIALDDTGTMKRYLALSGGEHVLAQYYDYLRAKPITFPRDVRAIPSEELRWLRCLYFVHRFVMSMAPLTQTQHLRMGIVLERENILTIHQRN